MRKIITLTVGLAFLLGSPSFAQTGFPEPGKYYKLQLRTSVGEANPQYLRIGNNGVAGGSTDPIDDGRSDWLFINTGVPNEYWIFSKGAQDGHGQALNFGDYAQWFGQWDFTGSDRQRFRLDKVGEYFRLVLKYKRLDDGEEAVSTRWNAESFAHRVNPTDEAQLFQLVESSKLVTKEDKLVSYLFWNINNDIIKSYFYNAPLNWLPQPQELRVNEIVFLNRSSRTVKPAIHHFGCGSPPSRDWKLQCWSEEIKPTKDASMSVDNYLRDAEAIWGLIGSGVLTVVAVAVTAGAGAAVLAASKSATTLAILGAAGLVVLDVAIIVLDVYDFGNSMSNMLKSDEVEWTNDDWTLNKFGVNPSVTSAISKNLGVFSFAVKGESYNDLMNGWYIHETVSDKGLYKMFFSGGKAVYIFTDYEVVGNWKADGLNKYLKISKSGDNLVSSLSSSLGDNTIGGSITYSPDPKIPNLYRSSGNDELTITSFENFTLKENGKPNENEYQRIYEFEGEWQLNEEQIFLSIAEKPNGLEVTKTTGLKDAPLGTPQFYERGAYANVYSNEAGDIYSISSANNLSYIKKGSQFPDSYERVEYFTFQSSNYSDRFIRHRSGFGWIEPMVPEIGTPSESDFYFQIVPGLADPTGVSLKSSGGLYFRNLNKRINLQKSNGSQQFMDDATFFKRDALDGSGGFSFESKTSPGYFIRHKGYALFLEENDEGSLFLKDASFKVNDRLKKK